jgi:hypothetical protein
MNFSNVIFLNWFYLSFLLDDILNDILDKLL